MNVDQVISIAEVSSVQEEGEMREQAERKEIEALERRMNDITNRAMEEGEELASEREKLELELQSELQIIEEFQVAIDGILDGTREQLQEMLDLLPELTDVSTVTLTLISTLQELREKNHAALRSDPIHTLVLEERYLTQQLTELMIPTLDDFYVYTLMRIHDM